MFYFHTVPYNFHKSISRVFKEIILKLRELLKVDIYALTLLTPFLFGNQSTRLQIQSNQNKTIRSKNNLTFICVFMAFKYLLYIDSSHVVTILFEKYRLLKKWQFFNCVVCVLTKIN